MTLDLLAIKQKPCPNFNFNASKKTICVVVIPFGFMKYLLNPHLTNNYWVSDVNCTTQQCHFPHVSLKPFSWGFNKPGLFQAPSRIHFLWTKPPTAFILATWSFLVCFNAQSRKTSHLGLASPALWYGKMPLFREAKHETDGC